MSEFIHEPSDLFQFDRVYLKSPNLISGGGFMTKFAVNGEALYIKTPRCKTKQGIVKSGKKWVCDLLFENEEENAPFVRWMENLVSYAQKKITDKRADWFQGNLTEEDIEDFTIQPIKSYRGGKQWIVRCNIAASANGGGAPQIKIYDERQNEIDLEQINEEMEVITLLEFCGVKCSLKSFQFEIEIKQMMVMKSYSILNQCLLGGGEAPTVAAAAAAAPSTKITFNETIEVKETETTHPTPTPEQMAAAAATEDEWDELDEEKPPISIEEDVEPAAIEFDDITEELDDILVETPTTPTQPPSSPSPPPVLNLENTELSVEPPKITEEPVKVEEKMDILTDSLDEFTPAIEPDEPIKLKTPNELYYNMYVDARRRAKEARQNAIQAYLEAQNIKNLYNLEDIVEESENEDDMPQNVFV